MIGPTNTYIGPSIFAFSIIHEDRLDVYGPYLTYTEAMEESENWNSERFGYDGRVEVYELTRPQSQVVEPVDGEL